jgi:hypothetical protein
MGSRHHIRTTASLVAHAWAPAPRVTVEARSGKDVTAPASPGLKDRP